MASVLGVVGLYSIGEAVHVLLLVGLMLLLVGVLTACDEAARRGNGQQSKNP